jgi:hypothetical protein
VKKLTLILVVVALSLLGATPAIAIRDFPWKDHAAPFTFLFGNDFDTHQQTQQLPNGSLWGFFYISYTGVVTKDGYRVATHVECSASTSCTVGWRLNGEPSQASFLFHEEPDHPVFLIDRLSIPPPGAHAHFHWLNGMPMSGRSVDGYLLQLTAMDRFCFIHHEPTAARASRNKTCLNNQGIEVNHGIDIATHLNIITSFPPGILRGI